MGALLQDLRYALRALAKSPGFTAAAILILALGIGANTAIFSLMDAVVLHPLPAVVQPAALVDVSGQTASYPWYRSVRAAAAPSLDLAAWRQREMSLSSGGTPIRIRGVVVSGNYFDVLGATPASGRLFSPADETSGEALVVLGQGIWKSRFGSDPAIAGKSIQLNGSPFTVVGVAPAGLRGTGFGVAPDLWVPIGAWPSLATGEFRTLDLERRGWGWLSVFGRLKPGISIAQAQASLDVAVAREDAAFPNDAPSDSKRTLEPTLRNAAGFGQSGNPVGFLAMLVGAAGIALAIACANLANLLLARAAARRREIAVRQALGASRGRLVRQLLTESLALGVLGGAAGLVVAGWSLGLIAKMPLPGDFSFSVFAPALDARALGFSLFLSIGTGLAFGLIPALQASGRAVGASLKTSGAAGTPRSTARGVLLVVQVSLCLLLLVGAGLLGRSLQSALATNVGFQPRGLTLASVNLGLQRYESSRAEAFLRDLRQRVAAAPGVRSAAWAGLVPMGSGEWVENFSIAGRPDSPAGKHPEAGINLVSADFYRTMQIPVAQGREFDDRLDRADSAPVALINEAMAKRYWPNETAVGRRITIGNAERTIVGVSRDFRTGSLRDAPTPQVYMPLAQGGPSAGLQTMTLVVRGENLAHGRGLPRPRGDPQAGRDPPAVRRPSVRGRARGAARAAAPRLGAARDLRPALPRARGGRDLRRDFLLRRRTHPRDRHPHGARRAGGRRASAGRRAERAPRGGRTRPRPCARRRRRLRAARLPLRHLAGRPRHLRGRDRPARRVRPRGRVAAGAPRLEDRSDGRAARRLRTHP